MSVNFNSTNPSAPTDRENIVFQGDAVTHEISAHVPAQQYALGITVDGGSGPPITGSKGFIEVPFPGTIIEWKIVADDVGDVQVTIKKGTPSNDTNMPSTTSIVAAAPPALSSQQRKRSTTLTGWTTTVAKKDIIEFYLDSITTISRFTLYLLIQRS